jgi:hypothetical protein
MFTPVSKIYSNIQVQRSHLASRALEELKVFLSDMSTEQISEWTTWTRAARLGELVYSEPCPPGYSLVKGSHNFKVRMLNLLLPPFQ